MLHDRRFSSWNIKRVAEAYCGEWLNLSPVLVHDVVTTYGSKVTRISFDGEVRVTIEILRDKYTEKEFINVALTLSLSPDPDDLKYHVLNTFQIGLFLQTFPDWSRNKPFTIGKHEPWDGSIMQRAARRFEVLITALGRFDSAFNLLIYDEFELAEFRLDATKLSLSHHLNQVKAFRLAEIYNNPEKLDEAIEQIINFTKVDKFSKERVDTLSSVDYAGGMDWLYTPEFLTNLRSKYLYPVKD